MKSLVWSVLAILALSGPLHAQAITTGNVAGTTKDQSAAAIPGVSITLSNPATGFANTILTDETGEFRFLSVASGSGYQLKADLPGFRVINVSEIVVRPGGSQRFDLVMEVANVAEDLKVTAEAPLINIDSSGISEGIDAILATQLPLARREVGELANSFQGMQYNASDNTLFIQTHSRGMATGATGYRVDGVLTNWGQNYAQGFRLPVTAVDQYELIQGGFSAEYGENAGAVVNMTTKSGKNDTYAAYSLHYLPFALTSTIHSGLANQAEPKAKSSNHLEEFSIGGKLIRDRLFYFSTTQFENLKVGNVATPKVRHTYFSAGDLKLTWNRTAYDRYDFSAAFTPAYNHGSSYSNPVISPESESQQRVMMYLTQVKNTRSLSSRMVMETSGSWYFLDVAQPMSDATAITPTGEYRGPLTTVDFVTVNTRAGNYTTGPTASWGGTIDDRARFSEKVTLQTRKHNLRLGIEYGRTIDEAWNREVTRTLTDQRQVGGTLTYLHNVYGRPYSASNELMLFVQDGWKVVPKVLLDLGFRLDGQQRIHDVHNAAPRIGLTVDPTGTGRSRIFANWGFFYQFVGAGTMNTGLSTIEQDLYRIDNADTNYNGTLVLQNIFRFVLAPKIGAPLINSWSTGFEQILPAQIKVGVTYAGNRQHRNFTTLQTSTQSFTNNDGRGSYQGLEVNWRRAFRSGLELSGSYTRSRSLADTSSTVTQLQLPYRYGYQDWHEPHVFNMLALISANGFIISPKMDYHSGRRYSITNPKVGTAVQFVDFQGKPAGRNVFAMPGNASMDVTIKREFAKECVQQRLVCSAGVSRAGVDVRAP